MEKIFKKYEFESQELAQTRINALGECPHIVIELGYLQAEEDELGMYSVDVLWNVEELGTEEDGDVDYPYGWRTKEVSVEGNGAHTFLGINYEQDV